MVSCKTLHQTARLLSFCALVLSFLTFFSTSTLNAQAPDCSKICYEYGTVSSGGSICVGSKGAVKPNSTVKITDSKGNSTTTTSRADGSFGASAATLEAPIGSTVTIAVNGKSCTTTVQRPNTCGNFYCAQYNTLLIDSIK